MHCIIALCLRIIFSTNKQVNVLLKLKRRNYCWQQETKTAYCTSVIHRIDNALNNIFQSWSDSANETCNSFGQLVNRQLYRQGSCLLKKLPHIFFVLLKNHKIRLGNIWVPVNLYTILSMDSTIFTYNKEW